MRFLSADSLSVGALEVLFENSGNLPAPAAEDRLFDISCREGVLATMDSLGSTESRAAGRPPKLTLSANNLLSLFFFEKMLALAASDLERVPAAR
jgi:hypothetical protein